MRLRQKNFLFVSLMMIIVITLSFGVLYFTMPPFYLQYKKAELTDEVNSFQKKYNNLPQAELIEKLEEAAKEKKSSSFWVLLDKKGEILYANQDSYVSLYSSGGEDTDSSESLSGEIVPEIKYMDSYFLNEFEIKNDFVNINSTITTKEGDDTILFSLSALQPISEAKTVLIRMYPPFLLAALIIGGVGAFIYSNFSTKRLRKLSANTRELMEMNQAILPIKDYGKDEIGELSEDIATLYQRLVLTIDELSQKVTIIQEKEQEKTEFMRIAAHELKTPLTSMTGIMEGMLYNVGEFKDHPYYLEVCLGILEEQRQLVSDILSVSKEDHLQQIFVTEEPIDIGEFLEEILTAPFLLLAKQRNVDLRWQLSPLLVNTNLLDLKKIFNNSLENAVKYTTVDGIVKVTIEQEKVYIYNQCVPLSEDDLGKIFEPFYRPDYARTREDGGTGLGLYIVGQLTKRQGIDCHFIPYNGEDFTGMVMILDFSKQVILDD